MKGNEGEPWAWCAGFTCYCLKQAATTAGKPMPIEANMHFAVHPGYNTSTMWSTICDNYLVGAAGVGDCLHKTEKKIFEVG